MPRIGFQHWGGSNNRITANLGFYTEFQDSQAWGGNGGQEEAGRGGEEGRKDGEGKTWKKRK